MKKPVNIFNLKGTYEVPSTMYVKLMMERFIAKSLTGGGSSLENSGTEEGSDYDWDD